MRYVLLRPRLKAGILRLLSINPGMLMTIKRFGVRIGLAHVMGHGHLAISGRRSDLAGQGRLSARGANIYDELRKAMIAKEG
ncbi:hypothetical protein [Pseudoxanthomonas sp.]|uniref:hypothetical protein n=1 Tax=Pseudoxanthomonas sp. TaxID=1871049 RepID=UPI00263409D2|nr:hypothetical protein [Pseudoxanthomonas sp.]WDS35631.1 MAG: hypothetical protein O8I58_15040 [Pseudoxanthomonas sp.]